MKIKLDYDECLNFIEKNGRIKLYPYQKMMLWAMCQGEPFSSCRGSGKTMLAKEVGAYVATKLDDFGNQPDAGLAFPYTTVMSESRLITEHLVEMAKNSLSPQAFSREYSLE